MLCRFSSLPEWNDLNAYGIVWALTCKVPALPDLVCFCQHHDQHRGVDAICTCSLVSCRDDGLHLA
ncbi:hypothetical protein B0H67DRAFT_560351 [Lasiosphaeris hirsuta]|uniref:Uncharacterized protein n=1 Tax=Lasiosphaeris hirsuta TaxID=260670 RepID=A0AA40B993_9PEZI|nr:hypothetical protein B0H67DRAFT_560351 [Lasiosphaeris hirsuta]